MSRIDARGAVGSHMQEALCRVLLLRPANPLEFMAEYFRTAAALDSLQHASVSAFPTPPVLHLSSGSSPLSRALFLLQASPGARIHAPRQFQATIAQAFDELTAGSSGGQPENGLLGSMLLLQQQQSQQQRPKIRPQSAAFATPTVQLRAPKQPAAAPTLLSAEHAGEFVEAADVKLLLQRLLAASDAAVPLPADLQRAALAALLEDALDERTADASDGAISVDLVSFSSFSRVIHAQDRLSTLYQRLVLLVLDLLPAPSSATTGDAILSHLQSASLPLADASELLSMLLRAGTNARSGTSRVSEAQASSLLAAFQKLVSEALKGTAASTPRGSAAAAAAAAHRQPSVPAMAFVRAVMQSLLDDLAPQQIARIAVSARNTAPSDQPSRQFAVDSHAASSLNGVHAAPYHNNQSSFAGGANAFQTVETFEYS